MRAPAAALFIWLAVSATALHASADYRLAVWPKNLPAPDFALQDDAGRTRSLHDFRGRTLLIFFGFVQCPDACPTELTKLSLVMKDLGPLKEHTQLLFITLDPKNDSPQVLDHYLHAFDPHFVGLRGTPAQVDEAARRFAVNYAPITRGAASSIDHSTSVYVMDSTGALRLVGGKSSSAADFVHDIRALDAERGRTTRP